MDSSESSSTGLGGSNKSTPHYVEFKLRSTSSTNFLHNIMTLGGPSVNISDFTTPVRLIRDPSVRVEDGESIINIGASDMEDKNVGRKKRKTRLVNTREDEEEQSTRNQERAPWLLEDFDGQHSYASQLMTPDAKYVIFVNQGNEFRVLLASKWYKFTPKLAYRPLTLEEAEERMASKGRNEDFDRWLMRKKRTPINTNQSASGESSGVTSAPPESKGPKVATRLVNLGEEGFDFEEFVDDDDGEDLYRAGNHHNDEDDPSMPRIERPRPIKNLTDAGKQVKKLVKHLDRPNYFYESDDEAADPYADEEDREPSDEEEYKMEPSKPPPTISQQKLPPIQPQKSLENLLLPPTATAATTTMIRSRSKSPSGIGNSRNRSKSPQTTTLKVPFTVKPGASSPPKSPVYPVPPPMMTGSTSSSSSSLLSEAEIIIILREAPLRTKDLISRVKSRLRADPQNKEIFREIVRRVATVKPSASQEDDKLLELKPEYR